jgi:hypothetical protein
MPRAARRRVLRDGAHDGLCADATAALLKLATDSVACAFRGDLARAERLAGRAADAARTLHGPDSLILAACLLAHADRLGGTLDTRTAGSAAALARGAIQRAMYGCMAEAHGVIARRRDAGTFLPGSCSAEEEAYDCAVADHSLRLMEPDEAEARPFLFEVNECTASCVGYATLLVAAKVAQASLNRINMRCDNPQARARVHSCVPANTSPSSALARLGRRVVALMLRCCIRRRAGPAAAAVCRPVRLKLAQDGRWQLPRAFGRAGVGATVQHYPRGT